MARNKKIKSSSVASPVMTDNWRHILIVSLIVIFTFIIFFKVIYYQLVLWDDNFYISTNPLIRDMSLEGLKRIFTTPVEGMYNPLLFFIYALEYRFGGLNPSVYHFTNLLMHLLAIITIYYFIFKLTKRYETATIVALLFAIHPMHVGVVTWVSEMKTSLFLIFYLLALANYLKYLRSNYKLKYLAYIALFFILSALSKPSAVTLAPMLLLLDYYVSRKIDWRMFLEKIPFFLIALFFGILTLYTHAAVEDSIFEINLNYSLLNNLLISNYSIVFYFNKLFLPFDLCTIYPYPDNDTFLPLKYYLSIPIIPFILWLIYKAGNFRRELIFGLLFFLIAISVVLRIVPSGFFRAANRYTYLSYTGLFFIIGQFITYVIDNRFRYAKKIKNYLLITLCLFVLFFLYQTSARISVWENSITLFDDIIKKKPKFALAYHNRALSKQSLGDIQGAIADFEKAIECYPAYASAYNNLGEIKRYLNEDETALFYYNKAIFADVKYANAYSNKGIILNKKGKLVDAMTNYNMAVMLNANHGPALHNRASIKITYGDTLGAMRDWQKSDSLGVAESAKPLEIFSAIYKGN
ncbi:MAG: tetratricopeptide repeat protein [Candidatus Roizmanbacteria bacterium]